MWAADCHAYALMPSGWDHWTPARGFFEVGKAANADMLSGRGDEGKRYTAAQAFLDNNLGPDMLLVITKSVGFWGCGEGSTAPVAVASLREAGVCLNTTGIYSGSLYRTGSGFAASSVLARCEGSLVESPCLARNTGGDRVSTPEEWAASSVLAEQVLERMREIPNHEVVCVTPELAAKRRAHRAVDREVLNKRQPMAEP